MFHDYWPVVAVSAAVFVVGLPLVAGRVARHHELPDYLACAAAAVVLVDLEAIAAVVNDGVGPPAPQLTLMAGAAAAIALFIASRIAERTAQRRSDQSVRATGRPIPHRLAPWTWYVEGALVAAAVGPLLVGPLLSGRSSPLAWDDTLFAVVCATSALVLLLGLCAAAVQLVRCLRARADYRFQLSCYELFEHRAHHDGN
jgi:hypothetical protein